MDERATRRGFLRGSVAIGVAGLAGEVAGGEDDLIVRNRRPLDAETPAAALGDERTPNRLFFVRSHFGAPAVGLLGAWSVAIEGGVRERVTLGVADLDKLESVTIPAVLQCAGNGRAFFSPTIPGVGWEKGAVGNASWTGVRLADLLERAGVAAGMWHVHLHAADAPPMPKTPPYLRSIPIERAIDRSTLVVTRMNGEALPVVHGGPVRLVVPGWTGNHWIKWLTRLVVARDEAPGFYMQAGYKLPIKPLPPGVDARPGETVPVTTMNVKSLITSPAGGSSLRAGRVEVRGFAWTGGEATIRRVEVASGPDWREATLEGPPRPFAWQGWRASVEVAPGRVVIRSRATDSLGSTQPEATPWNKSGYLWNGHDSITCEVR